MKQLSLAFLFLLLNMPNTNFSMKKELQQSCKSQPLSSFTKDTFEEDSFCSDLTVDLCTSCCAGLASAYSAHQIFSNNVAAPVAFVGVTFMGLALNALSGRGTSHREFNKKEKSD